MRTKPVSNETKVYDLLVEVKADVATLKQQNVSIVDRLDKINGRVGKSEDRLSDLEVWKAEHQADTRHAHEDIAEIKESLADLKESMQKEPGVKNSHSMFRFESATLLKIGLVVGGVLLAVLSKVDGATILEFLKSLV